VSACGQIAHLIDAYVDEELPTEKLLEIEQHLVDCDLCLERAQLVRAVRQSTRRAVLDRASFRPAFESRVLAALAQERQREETAEEPMREHKPLAWRYIAPLAAVAGLALTMGALQADDKPSQEVRKEAPSREANYASADQLLEELVNYHASSPEPAVTEPAQLNELEPAVGVPVRLLQLESSGARWEGGTVVPVVRNQAAALLRYRMNNHRITVYVYDPERVPLRNTRALEPRVVQNAAVFVGTRRGYSIAAVDRRGVGYAVATDLDARESAELVASIR
jgi:anti-sigma factor RsiW